MVVCILSRLLFLCLYLTQVSLLMIHWLCYFYYIPVVLQLPQSLVPHQSTCLYQNLGLAALSFDYLDRCYSSLGFLFVSEPLLNFMFLVVDLRFYFFLSLLVCIHVMQSFLILSRFKFLWSWCFFLQYHLCSCRSILYLSLIMLLLYFDVASLFDYLLHHGWS